MPQFFINRPVFAWVISILIMVLGGLAITQLPVAQYPSVAPPSISVTANYAGASAETLQETVTSIIEQQLNGIDNLLYMSSSSDASGLATVTLYFLPGTNPDTAQVQVQNKVQLATPSLPQTVQQQGVVVAKATRNFMMFFTLSTTNDSLDEVALGNYIASSVLDPIRRVSGVGEANMFGSQYAMRVWINPDKLNSFSLSAADVTTALQAQNAQVPVGQIGANPAVAGQQLNVVMQGRSTLRTVPEFENIILRTNPDGSRVLLKDVARVALGAENYGTKARVNGHLSAAVAIKLSPSANALNTAGAVREKVTDLSRFFPPGVRVDYPLDTSAFVKISIEEVLITLLEAIVLVFLVMYLFLQNIRATLIPTIVVPVALLGTFASMLAFGFSINVLTMFGMVLAIGILVDDAIVVVENVERIMVEEGLSPLEATRKAMGQITGALIGITLVLTAVFIPMAFFSGSVGTIYRQFSLSLVSAMLFSVFLAMSLTPALCATLLKPIPKGHKHEKRGLFGWFNRAFARSTTHYQSAVGRILKHSPAAIVVFLIIILLVGVLYVRLPSSFLPAEDQGYFITNIQLPVGATQERTDAVLKQVEEYFLAQPEIASFITVAGFSFNGRGQNSALSFGRLKDWSKRKGAEHTVQAVIARAAGKFASIKDAIIFPLNPPAIAELGNSTGFDFQLQDLAGLGHENLLAAQQQLLEMAAKNPTVVGVRVQGLEDAAQLKIDVDESKATTLGVSSAEINTTLQTSFGSSYVNNFVNGNRIQRVVVQLDAPYRMSPEDIKNVYVRNRTGTMVPLAAFTTVRWIYGSPQLQHYNGFPAYELVGAAAPGKSTGEAMDAMEEMAKKLPAGIGYEWTGQSYEERLSGSQAPMLYALSLLVVFLCLAALYESWSIPLSVILVVPLGILGALLATKLRGLPNDVYFKVGLLTIVGLATKNAILIIEYAKDLQAAGKELIEATLEAVHLRLRPILMTSFAFILGVMPLVVSTGAGSASRNAIGTGVAGGMLTATALGIFLIPVFYVVVRRLFKARRKSAPQATAGRPWQRGASRMKNRLLILVMGAFLGGCTMVPNYQRPAAPVSDSWPKGAAPTNGTNAAADIDWRDFFDDPRLKHLIGLALSNNRDLRLAALRVEQARAQYRIQRRELYPAVQGDAGVVRQKYSGAVTAFNGGSILTTYSVDIGAAYELDLFGRVRSLKEKALEQYFATDEARKSVQIALVSEVASQYLTLLQYREAKAIGQQTLDAVRASYDLNQRSFEAGVASELDLQTAATQVQTARVNIADYAQLLAQAENAFVLLVGEPLPLNLPADQTLAQEHLLTDLPAGLPSEVLQRRPDILAAEHTLKAANADIGAARAAFFPRILLTGSGGTASATLTDLFTGPSATWSFSPQIIIPIFDADGTWARLDASKISKRIEIVNYEKAIQTAFREVADALAVRSIIDEKLEAQKLLLAAQQKRFDLTNARYRQGVDNYVNVLLAQEDLYAARQALLRFQAARLLDAVALYRSLGGGWKS